MSKNNLIRRNSTQGSKILIIMVTLSVIALIVVVSFVIIEDYSKPSSLTVPNKLIGIGFDD